MKISKLIASFNRIKKSKSPFFFWIVSGFFVSQAVFSADLGFAPPPCPAAGSGSRIVYLSEEIPGVCNDASQVQAIIFQLGPTGTLVVDKSCKLNAGLRLPSRFTLKGTGIGSAGILAFSHDGIAISVCQESPRGYVTISDLDLYGPYSFSGKVSAPHSKGIALANLNIVHLSNIRVTDFYTGVVGSNSYSVLINGSNISNNRADNIQLGYASNAWRIRDSLVSWAGGWGINVQGKGDARPLEIGDEIPWETSNDLLIDGLRMESNRKGGIRTNADSTRIINNRFEHNGQARYASPGFQGVLVDTEANDTRILSNFFSTNCINNLGGATEQAFNINDEICNPGFLPGLSP